MKLYTDEEINKIIEMRCGQCINNTYDGCSDRFIESIRYITKSDKITRYFESENMNDCLIGINLLKLKGYV
jgi:hypothetical protein